MASSRYVSPTVSIEKDGGEQMGANTDVIAADRVRELADMGQTTHGLATPEATPAPEDARLIADKTRQQTDRAREIHGLATPEATPAPEDARLIADKTRQQTDTVPETHGLATPDTTPAPEEAGLRADKALQQTAESANKAPSGVIEAASTQAKSLHDVKSPPASSDRPEQTPRSRVLEGEEGPRRDYTEAQKTAVDRVLDCSPTQYYQILGVNDPCSKEDATRAFKRLALVTHPDKTDYPNADEAFKRVLKAAEVLEVPDEHFAENAFETEDLDDDDDDVQGPDGVWRKKDAGDPMEGVESTPPQPNQIHRAIYAAATPYITRLMENPDDADAKDAVKKLNKEIHEWNSRNQLLRDTCEIKWLTLIKHFEMAKPYYVALEKDPTDATAKAHFEKTKVEIEQLCERYFYPEEWVIVPPSKPSAAAGTSSSSATKAQLWRPGLTRDLEPILAYRKVGPRGHQFIVQTGTKENPLYDLRSGSDIGFKAANGYLEMKEAKIELKEVDKDGKKYSREDATDFQEILGVASKPIQTKAVGKGFRYPVTFVLVSFRTKGDQFISRTTLRKVLGKTDADREIEDYYDARKLTPPWKVAPKRTRVRGKSRKAAYRDTSEEESSGDENFVDDRSEAEISRHEDIRNHVETPTQREIDLEIKVTKLEEMIGKLMEKMTVAGG